MLPPKPPSRRASTALAAASPAPTTTTLPVVLGFSIHHRYRFARAAARAGRSAAVGAAGAADLQARGEHHAGAHLRGSGEQPLQRLDHLDGGMLQRLPDAGQPGPDRLGHLAVVE